jgi:hypothetical protein
MGEAIVSWGLVWYAGREIANGRGCYCTLCSWKTGVPHRLVPTVSLAAWPMVERSDQWLLPLDHTVTMLAVDDAPSPCQ